ncbi:sulfurtransferase TusA family protein [Psychrobacter sp. I-STPA10]|uniref:sulfurtransferase TusA family protein n=1 Tax=Psychrobacter sp. I-STPA10 TaxID=2585769 RepID=UPI001E401FDD|nr:sulfurtransferase TusA family protein [Psychrobacter sp. I-STPA10]
MTQINFSYPEAAKPWLDVLPTEVITSLPTTSNIAQFIDGQNLSCPMPLLKTKVALRTLADGDMLYVIATDPNSQADITAFCHQSQLSLQQASTDSHGLNVYHFFITKA